MSLPICTVLLGINAACRSNLRTSQARERSVQIGLPDLQPINDAMIEDIGNMLALVRAEEFRVKRTCVLNPTFGDASLLVGGADGDRWHAG